MLAWGHAPIDVYESLLLPIIRKLPEECTLRSLREKYECSHYL